MQLNPSEISDLIKSRIQNMQLAATAGCGRPAGRQPLGGAGPGVRQLCSSWLQQRAA